VQSPVGPQPPAVMVNVSKTDVNGAEQDVADPVLSAVDAPLSSILQSVELQLNLTVTLPPQPEPTPTHLLTPSHVSVTTPRGAVPPAKWA